MNSSLKNFFASTVTAARDVGHEWAGIEHIILAILREPQGSPGRKAIETCGVTYDRYADRVRSLPRHYVDRPEIPRSVEGVTWARESQELLARAEGLVAGLGDWPLRSHHFLLALAWSQRPPTVAEQVLSDLGADREELVTELEQYGVAMPPSPLPGRLKWAEPKEATREEYNAALKEMSEGGPPYRIGFKDGRILISKATGSGR